MISRRQRSPWPLSRRVTSPPIGPSIVAGRGPKLVLGPGTGLGVAALARCGETFLPLPGEGGHVGIGPQDAEDDNYWPRIARQHGRITAETLLCGPGLATAACRTRPRFRGGPVRGQELSRRPGSRKPRLPATTRMRRQPRGSSMKLLARTAGDLALVLGATGGVFLRGGRAACAGAADRAGGIPAAFHREGPGRCLRPGHAARPDAGGCGDPARHGGDRRRSAAIRAGLQRAVMARLNADQLLHPPIRFPPQPAARHNAP